VGYYRKGKLFRTPVGGGTSLEIADVPPPLRISWTPDGLIVFSDRRRIITVPATGGRPKPITQPDSAHGEAAQLGALTIDDGRTIVYTSVPSSGLSKGRLAVTTVDGETPTVLDIGGAVTPVGFVENHLLSARDDGVLLAVPFDVRRRRTTGPPRGIANGIGVVGVTMSVTALSPTERSSTPRTRIERSWCG
jgi:hypothetical protein